MNTETLSRWATGVAVVVSLIVSIAAFNATGRLGASPGPDYYGLQTFLGGMLRGNVNATSTTATSYTMVPSDIRDYDTIIMTPNTGALTLTFFASSTATSFLPKAGMMQETCFYNATTTAGATITFVAGTGIDWEIATSTNDIVGTPATIAAGESACFKFIRQNSTASAFDISALYQPYVNAD